MLMSMKMKRFFRLLKKDGPIFLYAQIKYGFKSLFMLHRVNCIMCCARDCCKQLNRKRTQYHCTNCGSTVYVRSIS